MVGMNLGMIDDEKQDIQDVIIKQKFPVFTKGHLSKNE